MFTHEPFEVASNADHAQESTPVVEQPAPRPRRGRPPRRVEMTVTNDVAADVVVHDPHPVVEDVGPVVSTPVIEASVAEPVVAPQLSEPVTPFEPETTEPVILGAENKPRRGGWWARKS